MGFKNYYTEAEKLKGGLADNKTIEDIFKKHKDKGWKGSLEDIKKELEMGKKVEKEHLPDGASVEEIAKDHIFEIPDYYSRLDKMENEATK